MHSTWRRGSTAIWLALATAAVALWVVGMKDFRSAAETHFLWNAPSAAIVFGMAIIGLLAALVAGGSLGLGWPWRTLGVLALAPFAVLIAVFSYLSGGGGTCSDEGTACSVSVLLRFGGLLVTLGCCAAAAATARAVARRCR
jgi:hypothetical protein